jgi:uroporphyrinogen-III decarboxylase
MTPRDRILAVLNRKPVDRIPVDLWHTPEVGEVRDYLDTLGADGTGYICCSCHNVQAGTLLENIQTVIEAAQCGSIPSV